MKEKSMFPQRGIFRNPTMLILAAYLAAFLLGTILLLLPISTQSREITSPLTALFTSASALCVTGLTTVTTAAHWSLFGQVIVLILIQLGGLGVTTAAAGLAMVLGRHISMQNRMLIAEEKNAPTPGGMARLIRFILAATFLMEAVGAILLAIRFVPVLGWGQGVWKAVFHSISAFCNAGFDLMGTTSLSAWRSEPLVLVTIALLVILGGLGFPVYRDMMTKKRWKHFRLHTKIVLSATGILLVSGTVLFWLLEHNNIATMGSLSLPGQWLNAFFQSTTCRTAGFSTFSQASLTQASCLIAITLMFVGGSPVGTAGGVKTTTMFTLLHSTRGEIGRGKRKAVYGRHLPGELTTRASAIVLVAIIWCAIAAFIVSIAEPQVPFLDSLFEVVSAFGTVGLSRGLTSTLSVTSQLTLIVTMLFGKIGPLTVLYALSTKPSGTTIFKEAEESIFVG